MIVLNETECFAQILHAAEMCMERITSKSNKMIKDTRKLISSSRARAQSGLFVLEGARLCFDVLNSVYKPEYVLMTDRAYQRYQAQADKLIQRSRAAYFISDELADKLSDTESAQGIFAVCAMQSNESDIEGRALLALDNVQDPANVGSVIRTAEALGIDGILLYNCCDEFNPKTLRTAMGSVLRIKLYHTDNLEDTLTALKASYRIYATVPDREAVKITENDFSAPSICVIGNEANGVEEGIKAMADDLITIPMLGNAESLNAGVAAAITMWEMLR